MRIECNLQYFYFLEVKEVRFCPSMYVSTYVDLQILLVYCFLRTLSGVRYAAARPPHK